MTMPAPAYTASAGRCAERWTPDGQRHTGARFARCGGDAAGARRAASAHPGGQWRMITKQDLESLIAREETGRPVVSLFLDMSVNSNNKRTHQVFLNQKRAQFQELQAEWMAEHEEGVETLWDRVQRWLSGEHNEANCGAVIYAEVGGEWFEALQTRAALQNRLIVAPRPVVAPLAQALEGY